MNESEAESEALVTGRWRSPESPERRGRNKQREKLQASYKRLLNVTEHVATQAARIAEEVTTGVKKSKQLVEQLHVEALQAELGPMIPRSGK